MTKHKTIAYPFVVFRRHFMAICFD